MKELSMEEDIKTILQQMLGDLDSQMLDALAFEDTWPKAPKDILYDHKVRAEVCARIHALIALYLDPDERFLRAGYDTLPISAMRCSFEDFTRQVRAVLMAAAEGNPR
jgi:hypothetical protein